MLNREPRRGARPSTQLALIAPGAGVTMRVDEAVQAIKDQLERASVVGVWKPRHNGGEFIPEVAPLYAFIVRVEGDRILSNVEPAPAEVQSHELTLAGVQATAEHYLKWRGGGVEGRRGGVWLLWVR